MKNIALISTLIVASLALSSCATEELSNEPSDVSGNKSRLITLYASLPSFNSRGSFVSTLDHCVVTIFNTNTPHRNPGNADDKSFNPWYETQSFTVNDDGDGFTNENVIWPEKDSPETGDDYGDKPLMFYAHYPDMGNALTPVNSSTYTSDTEFSVDYALDGFTVNGDISEHIDFMTAYATGMANAPGVVELDFRHELSAIEIQAKGQHSKYNIEIAGVKIGNIIDKGKYSFQPKLDADGNVNYVGGWITGIWNEDKTEISKSHNAVEYIHQKNEEHVIPAKDVTRSIMGNAGHAMVIPFRGEAWDNKNDPGNEAKGAYFAVLVRVTDKDGNQVFPYTSESAKPEGYKDGLRVAATIGDKQYGWAAIPVKLNLQSGKKYCYTLDFSKGIGVLPTDDPDPGKPLFANDHIDISLSVYDWVEEEIDITPDLSGDNDGDQEGGDQSGDEQNNGENGN